MAIATPPGRGGLGMVRLSGPAAPAVACALLGRTRPLRPRHATFGRVQAGDGPLDEVIATWFDAPRSYTGEHVVEISAHGSPVVLRAIVRQSMDAGARLARPGEFTLRAFLNGRRDLVQAEAVADLIAAATPLQARVACDQLDGTLTGRLAAIEARLFDLIARLEASLDFPDEGYHFVAPAGAAAVVEDAITAIDALLGDAHTGRLIREGATVVVAGRPNVGKSSLFNRLAGSERAIVTEVPGTTRDLVAERVDVAGLALTLIDTAGARETTDPVEREGVARGAEARAAADLVLVVLDAGEALTEDDRALLASTRGGARLVIANKHDRPPAWNEAVLAFVTHEAGCDGPIFASARTGEGLIAVRERIARVLAGGDSLRDAPGISNLRHVRLLEEARAHLVRARDAAAQGALSEEFVLIDLQAARGHFDEIVGRRTDEDLLRHIFDRFCIGK